MYEFFGYMETAAEINEVAASLREEGEKDNLIILLKENGLAEDLVDLYMSGDIDTICDDANAAVGRISVEVGALKADKYIDVIKHATANYLMVQCVRDDDFAKRVRDRNKSLQGCMDACVAAIKKEMGGGSGGVADTVVFLAAKNYFKS